ncbi:MAG: fatty acid desaturase [Bdellovibrionota bacterium]
MRQSDYRSLAFVALTIASFIMPFVFAPLSFVAGVGFFILNLSLAFICTLVTHNQIHCPTFASPWMNRALELALTIARGSTVTGMIVPHSLNHHPHNGSSEDWIRVDLAGEGPYLVRLCRYTWVALKSVAREKSRSNAPRLTATQRRHLLQEKAVLYGVIAAFLAWNPMLALTVVGLPWIFAMLTLLGTTILQHEGCDPLSFYDHSRNFESSIMNWFFLNNGYHTAHHLFPEMHWSELPAVHAKIASQIDPALNEWAVLPFVMREISAPPRTTRASMSKFEIESPVEGSPAVARRSEPPDRSRDHSARG